MPTEISLETLNNKLDRVLSELAPIKVQLDGLPLLNRAIENLRRDTRAVKSAVNDMARDQVTPGEITALHDDVDGVQTNNAALEHRLATVERLLKELTSGG
jgi:ubiquinone biosynthesis protein UbiJ